MTRRAAFLAAAWVAALATAAARAADGKPPEDPQARPVITGRRGVVTSLHPLSSMAGMQMLMKGGNAFDAAVAAAAAVAVFAVPVESPTRPAPESRTVTDRSAVRGAVSGDRDRAGDPGRGMLEEVADAVLGPFGW
ncbi:MAG: hypothetical protein ACRDZ1_00765 [Acidimicrobiia bacterium]